MRQGDTIRFTVAWVAPVITGVGILGFGLIVAAFPVGSDPLSQRATGVASIGMGLFGIVIAAIPYRRYERWAWFTLWYYPEFWLAHLLGGLPPGKDHIHQVEFIVLSLIGLLLPAGEFFSREK